MDFRVWLSALALFAVLSACSNPPEEVPAGETPSEEPATPKPPEPFTITNYPSKFAVVGTPWSFRPVLSRSGPVRWQFLKAPAGARVEGGVIVWTPADKHAGVQQFSLRALMDGLSSDLAFSVTVTGLKQEAAGQVDPQSPNGTSVSINAPLSPVKGSAVVLSPGSLTSATPVEVSISSVTGAPLPLGAQLSGLSASDLKPVEFGPTGLTFAKPVTIYVPVTAALLAKGTPKVQTYDFQSGRWESVPVLSVDTQAGIVAAQVNHFSMYVGTTAEPLVSLSLSQGGQGSACTDEVLVRSPLQIPFANLPASQVNGAVGNAQNVGALLSGLAEGASLQVFTRITASSPTKSLNGWTLASATKAGAEWKINIASSTRPDGFYSTTVSTAADAETWMTGSRFHLLFALGATSSASATSDVSFYLLPQGANPLAPPVNPGATMGPAESKTVSPLSGLDTYDNDCDGLPNTYDSTPNQVPPSLSATPPSPVRLLLGQSQQLNVVAEGGSSVSWTASDSGVGLSASGSSATLTPSALGTYIVTVSAEKNGTRSSYSWQIFVDPATAQNTPPKLSIAVTPSLSVRVGEKLVLDAIASDAEQPASSLVHSWTAPAGLSGSSSGRTYVVTFQNPGDYAFTATVSDGTASTSASVTVSVLPASVNRAPEPPVVTPLAATFEHDPGTRVYAILSANATDPDGDSVTYEFTPASTNPLQSTFSQNGSTATFSGVLDGEYVFYVRAIDSKGQAGGSTQVKILLTPKTPPSATDSDGDGYPSNTDCNDANASIRPGAKEICADGIDQDCSGADRSLADCDSDGDGVASSQGDCADNDAARFPGAYERCDNKDNDCDGQTDESFGKGQACTSGIGACGQTGTQVCNASGTDTVCSASAKQPSAETCNNLDDDCDGLVDDVPADAGANDPTNCGGCGRVCSAGSNATATCSSGACGVSCAQGYVDVDKASTNGCECQLNGAEVCNGRDDDCDGFVDEDTGEAFYTGPAGTSGVGVCQSGAKACFSGTLTTTRPERTPATEACNGADDDCDGTADETWNFQEDQNNCGGCGIVCGGGSSCVSGKCVTADGGVSCGAGQTYCPGLGCTDTVNNPYHCGGCGIVCGTGKYCSNRQCVQAPVDGGTTATLSAAITTPSTGAAVPASGFSVAGTTSIGGSGLTYFIDGLGVASGVSSAAGSFNLTLTTTVGAHDIWVVARSGTQTAMSNKVFINATGTTTQPDAGTGGGSGSDGGSCVDGCVTATGSCVIYPQQTNSLCGSNGQQCMACGTGTTCQSGKCLPPTSTDGGTLSVQVMSPMPGQNVPTAFTVSGKTTPGSLGLTVFIDGAGVASAMSDGAGNFNIGLTTSAGAHELWVVGQSGSQSSMSNRVPFTAGTTSSDAGSSMTVTLSSPPSGTIIQYGMPWKVTGTTSQPGADIIFYGNNSQAGVTTANATGYFEHTFNTWPPNGTYPFYARAQYGTQAANSQVISLTFVGGPDGGGGGGSADAGPAPSCADGCFNATGTCVTYPQQNNSLCGSNGQQCMACGTGTSCQSGKCLQTSTSDGGTQTLTVQLQGPMNGMSVPATGFEVYGITTPGSLGLTFFIDGAPMASGMSLPSGYFNVTLTAARGPHTLWVSAQSGTQTVQSAYVNITAVSSTADGGSGGGSGSDGGTLCHSLANTAPTHTEQQQSQAAPMPTGGQIGEGLYHRVATTVFTGDAGVSGPTGDTRRETLRVIGGGATATVEIAGSDNGAPTSWRTYSVALSGTTMNISFVCGGSGSFSRQYSARPDSFEIIETTATSTKVNYYVRQQGGTADGGAGGGTGADGGATLSVIMQQPQDGMTLQYGQLWKAFGQTSIGGANVTLIHNGTQSVGTTVTSPTGYWEFQFNGTPSAGSHTLYAQASYGTLSAQTPIVTFIVVGDPSADGGTGGGAGSDGGTSACPPGQSFCAGSCRDYLTDETACGACGYTCQAGYTCSSGACYPSTAPDAGPTASCGLATTYCTDSAAAPAGCYDTRWDGRACGVCGNSCGSGTYCEMGMCKPSGGADGGAAGGGSGSDGGTAACNGCTSQTGSCVSYASQTATMCGSAGQMCMACPGGYVCSSGQCMPGTSSDGGSTGGTCQSGQTRSCYSGPPGTEGIGACRTGSQLCQSGSWPPYCDGEVTPRPEMCGDNQDNDCDGQTDEGCPLQITPGFYNVLPGTTVSFSASGGSAPYTWTAATNASGGSLTGSSWTAGQTAGSDIIRVTDSTGQFVSARVNVSASNVVTLSPSGGTYGYTYLRVNVTTTVGATVTATVDGGAVPVQLNSQLGTGSLDLSLGAGTTSLQVTSVNQGLTATTTGSYTYDNVPPATPIILTPAAESSVSGASHVISGSSEPGSNVELSNVYAGGMTMAMVLADGGFSANMQFVTGQHLVSARAQDNAGNWSTDAGSVYFTVLNGNAAPLSIYPRNGSVKSGGTLRFLANGGTPPYTFSTPSTSSSISASGTFTAGQPATETVTVTDGAGQSTSTTVNVQPPLSVNITYPSNGVALAYGQPFYVTGTTSMSGAQVKLIHNGTQTVGQTVSDPMGTWRIDFNSTPPVGNHTVYAEASIPGQVATSPVMSFSVVSGGDGGSP